MRRTLLSMALGCACAAWLASPAWSGMVGQRQKIQEQRIQAGIDQGQLTKHEVKRLDADEATIHSMRHDARAAGDGTIAPPEENAIMHEEDAVSRQIYQLKHNDDVPPPAKPVPTANPAVAK